MTTQVNGKNAPWTPEIEAKWTETANGREHLTVLVSNYFTPRPWRNHYDCGSTTEGFTYVAVKASEPASYISNPQSVYQVILKKDHPLTREPSV